MNHGVIEQVGPPLEVYERPTTPFVADFIGKVNVLSATCVGDGRYRVGRKELTASADGIAPGRPVRLYLRPEDRILADSGPLEGRPNCSPASCAASTFSHLLPGDGRRRRFDGQSMLVYCSLNQALELDVREGARLPFALRGDRVRVFRHDERRSAAAEALAPLGGWPAGRRGHDERRCAARAAAAQAVAADRGAGGARGVVLLAVALLLFLTVPLASLLVRSLQDRAGEFVGVANFVAYFASPAFANSATNTLVFAALTTLFTVPQAFLFAYAIQRSCIPFKGLWRNIAMIPILAPSLLAALSFIYLFGNQGWLKFVIEWFGIKTVYGLPGMVMAMSFASFPHAVMILLAGLALSTRGCTRRPTRWPRRAGASSSPSRCRARATA